MIIEYKNNIIKAKFINIYIYINKKNINLIYKQCLQKNVSPLLSTDFG